MKKNENVRSWEGNDQEAVRCCLSGFQVLIKQMTGADQQADSC